MNFTPGRPALFTFALLIVGAGATRAASPAGPGFRVRSDFAAGLNVDQGWAGALNEHTGITADQPFRVRFEVEPAAGHSRFSLQYRRNRGPWTPVEAHDFPKPEAELNLDFADDEPGAVPKGWRLAEGDASRLRVAPDGARRLLRARAENRPLLATYPPPWDSSGFNLAAEIRLPAGGRGAAGLVFGEPGSGIQIRVLLDPTAGAIRVVRLAGGVESVMGQRQADIPFDRWLRLEAQVDGGELEVNFNDAIEFTVPLARQTPSAHLGLYLAAGGQADIREFTIEGEPRTPRVSVVSCPAYRNGAATTDLLRGSTAAFQPGAGLSLAPRTGPHPGGPSHAEFEWALVVRRFADAAETNEPGDTFELRMVDHAGQPLTSRHPRLTLAVPAGHLGGTFVETPGRIGPWRAANGDLYFIMEPAETDNLFMMVKSSDGGRTWREVDGAHRPATGDLESVEGRQVGHTIHIGHQVTRSMRYHSFRTSDHPTHPDTWHVRDERAASAESVAQSTTLVARSDGSLVTFYTASTLHYAVRSPAGRWSAETVLDRGIPPNTAGPKAVLGANDTVHLAYYGMDGTVWYRRLLRDGTLTPRQELASGVGATRAEFGAVLPLVFIPDTNTVVIVYQQADKRLWERRIADDGPPSAPVLVSHQPVVRDAVDAQQPGADVVWHGGTVHVLFVDDATREIFSTHDRGGWQPPQLRVGGIRGSWVRGNIWPQADGVMVYGYVYDAGSEGGAGLNRFGEWILPPKEGS